MFLWLSESKNLFPTLPPEKKKKAFHNFFLYNSRCPEILKFDFKCIAVITL